jgi:hypothetical protein
MLRWLLGVLLAWMSIALVGCRGHAEWQITKECKGTVDTGLTVLEDAE